MMSRLGRARLILPTLAAMFSLFISAVSACACSHHQPVKAESDSCHGSSHETSAAEQPSGLTRFESGCICFARTPVPAIAAKKGDKQITVEEQIADAADLQFTFAIEFDVAVAPDVSFEPPASNYQRALLSSLPSRAPPRL